MNDELKQVLICACGHTEFAHNDQKSECASCRQQCRFNVAQKIETTDVMSLIAERDYILKNEQI